MNRLLNFSLFCGEISQIFYSSPRIDLNFAASQREKQVSLAKQRNFYKVSKITSGKEKCQLDAVDQKEKSKRSGRRGKRI